jgi:putative sigma-54 modulation protein
MELQLTSKGINVTTDLRRHIESKLGRFNRHLKKVIETKAEVSEQKTKAPQDRFMARVTLNTGSTMLHSEERGENLLVAIDRVAQSMERQIEHYKGKLQDRGRGSSPGQGKSSRKSTARKRVVKVKRLAVKPMSVDEAADQMELLGHDFFLFLNAESGNLSLLYKRKDGNYGLIEPELD